MRLEIAVPYSFKEIFDSAARNRAIELRKTVRSLGVAGHEFRKMVSGPDVNLGGKKPLSLSVSSDEEHQKVMKRFEQALRVQM